MPGNWEDHHEREQGPSRRKSQPTGMLQSQHIWRRGNLPPAPSSFLLSVLTAACCLLEVPETVELGQGPLPPSRRTLDGSRFAIPQAFRNNCHGSFLSKSFNCLTYSLEFSWGHKHSGGHKGNPSVHVVKLLPRPQRPPRCSMQHLLLPPPSPLLPAPRQYGTLAAFRGCQQGRAALCHHCMRPAALGSLQELLLTAASATGRRGASACTGRNWGGRRKEGKEEENVTGGVCGLQGRCSL